MSAITFIRKIRQSYGKGTVSKIAMILFYSFVEELAENNSRSEQPQYPRKNCNMSTEYNVMKKALMLVVWISLMVSFVRDVDAADYYDWDVRTDRYGKRAGIFDKTPFPITENTTDYSIRNDEHPNGKTFYLGTKYYVDGTNGADSNDGLSLSNAKKTISSAIATAGDGNITIIVRGGTYYIQSGLVCGVGDNDTRRWMLVGYGQERPVISGESVSGNIIQGGGETDSFVTLQRIKVQNSQYEGLAFGSTVQKEDSNLNIIDVWIYNTTNFVPIRGDGNTHFDHVDNLWIFHSSSEHTYDHCYKIGDDCENTIIEWSIAKECAYWPGIPDVTGGTACGFDFPSDSPEEPQNMILRYSIASDILFSCAQIRRQNNYSVHHNEFYNCPNFDAVTGERTHLTAQGAVIIHQTSYGSFHHNVIRSGPDGEGTAVSDCSDCLSIGLGLTCDSPETSYFYNNLFWDISRPIFFYGYGGDGLEQHHKIYSNSIYGNSNNTLVYVGPSAVDPAEDDLEFVGNIVYQSGSHSNSISAGFDSDVAHTHNLYYAPSGSIGISLDPTELSADPKWQEIPSGQWKSGFMKLSSTSPAIDNGVSYISTDVPTGFLGVTRPRGPVWDIGAYEYSGTATRSNNIRE